MKNSICYTAIVVLAVTSLYLWVCGPDSKLHDYRMDAYYVDGGMETFDLDSVAYFRAELNRVGFKLVYGRYENGEYELHLLGQVTRYRLHMKRPPYKNDTCHFQVFRGAKYSVLALMIVPIVMLANRKKKE